MRYVSVGSVLALVALTAVTIAACASAPQSRSAFTTGNVLKFQNTEITEVQAMATVDRQDPHLNFSGRTNSGRKYFSTQARLVVDRTAAGALFYRTSSYFFELHKTGPSHYELLGGRRAYPGETTPIDLLGTGTHAPTAFDVDDVFDLRPDPNVLAGSIEVAVTTTTRQDPHPKKRVYHIDVQQLEQKLPQHATR